jgi:transcriptional regulator with XRE-family HTH domain
MLTHASYLKAYRQRSGLSQADVARLLGFDAPVSISRYETFQRVPHLETALALEILFDASIAQLFPQVAEKVIADLLQETTAFQSDLENGELSLDSLKITTLADIHARLIDLRTPLL